MRLDPLQDADAADESTHTPDSTVQPCSRSISNSSNAVANLLSAGRDPGGVRSAACVRHGRAFQPGFRRRAASGRAAWRDQLRRYPHEGAAAFAASAYGKLTGRPALCLAIAGPGSTNLLTGPYDARLDQSPVLAISGQVASKVLGRGAFQDLNLSAVFKDVATSSVTLQAGSDHAELAALAVKRALDRRGVAHLILPDEVQILLSDQPAAAPEGRLAGPAGTPPAAELAVAAGWVSTAARPVIVAGHGVRGARDRVLALAERLGAPVLTTFKAKGLIPDSHPLGAGYWAAAVLRWPAG